MKKTPALAALILAALSSASYAVTVSHSFVVNTYGTGNDLTVSSTDLINNGQPTVVNVTTDYVPLNSGYGAATVLTDGIASGGDSFRTLPSNLQSFTITYDLNTVSSPLGYDITSIFSVAGNPDARARQEYYVYYSLVGDSSFIQLPSESFTTDRPNAPFQTNTSTSPGATAGGGGGETGLTILINGLSGVDQIRIVTSVATGNSTAIGGTVYREFDVNGTATVPEASVASLLGVVGTLGILRRRR